MNQLNLINVEACGAVFSECRTWRYGLWRIWDEALPMIAF